MLKILFYFLDAITQVTKDKSKTKQNKTAQTFVNGKTEIFPEQKLS